MSDDFKDKYVDSDASKTPTKRGSVKKDLLGMKTGKKAATASNAEVDNVQKDVATTRTSKVAKKDDIVEVATTEEVIKEEIQSVITEPKAKRTRKTTIVDALEVTNEPEIVEEESQAEEEIIDVPASEPRTRRSRKKSSDRAISLEDYNTNYMTKSLSQTIHESMIPYSEFVIMDRAIPRVEDGLKPVQRRVLYSMLEVGVLPDRPYKKSASIVGECMGKYHPHGDTSIYDTLVRMAQNFNMGETLVDGHGNFGSVDGDPPAAMRYTEAKLTPLAMEMLRDLEKDTVTWGLNFDDRLKEPQMLPGRFPNLLVNGCQGIAVGLATNIPTHNLAEACNAVIAYIDNRKITLDEIMKVMPAPDFPSGGYILDTSEIKQIYEKGKGKIFIRSKISIENADNGKKNIVITEIPYQVNKASMLQKIAKYRDANINGPLGAIQEIVDESDRFGTRAVIKLKKEAKINTILNTLYKYCDLQTTFGANIIAIADGKPKQMGLLEILEYYVNYQQKVIYNRTNYDLEEALKKEHILEGLLIAIRNIDEVVRIIKNSKSVTDAKITLIKTFDLSEIQAQAILDMRLARLTSLEVNKLITDLNRLRDLIKRYTAILKSPTLQMKVVKSEIQEIIKAYGKPRKTKFLSANEHFEDSSSVLESIENEAEDIQTYHIIATPANTLKLVNLKSYKLVSKDLSANAMLSEVPKISFKIDDNKDVYVMTNRGNSIKIEVKSIEECKFRDKGTSLFSMVKNIVSDENIVAMLELDNTIKDTNLIFVTKNGMIKISKVSDFLVSKHVISAIKLAKADEIVFVGFHNPDKKLSLFTASGNAVKVDTSDIPASGRVGLGVKGIALDKGDYVVCAMQTGISDAYALFYSDGYAKIVKQMELADSARNRKGLSFLGSKSKNAKIVYAGTISPKTNYVVEGTDGKLTYLPVNMIPLDTRTGSGKSIAKAKVKNIYPFIDSQK
ncbi:MAG: DNA topoisomerase 4 subunit A [Clostridiales bacterium]|nr:DNA topoisomerase 4 subunit A [Clostridiales bacterium]